MDEFQADSLRIKEFDASLPIEKAVPPPATWYLDSAMHALEKETVFKNNWLVVGHIRHLQEPGSFLAGKAVERPFVVTRDEQGNLGAFHNVCIHHGTRVADGCGKTEYLTCPYHGWQYKLNGRLAKAPRAGAIEQLKKRSAGLTPIACTTWGPFVLLNFAAAPKPLTANMPRLKEEEAALAMQQLTYVTSKTYDMQCNWKVFVDNYLDGGYHVPHMHPGLTEHLDEKRYTTRLEQGYSVQSCPADGLDDRLGKRAIYLWLYPNFMINRYGPWMDTNLVIPLAHDRCRVRFDYYHDGELADGELDHLLKDSHQVQMEDMNIVHMVQEGMGSEAYKGLYAPNFEASMYQFHKMLHHDLTAYFNSMED